MLLLQGPLSPLYRRIGRHLAGAGVAVQRVNLCPGDRAAWGFGPAIAYRGRLADWPGFVAAAMERHRVDAVLMHSERRPYHREAAAEARARDIDVLVTELGYLRPDWMTLERNGNSIDSLFPVDPEAVRALAAGAAEPDPAVRHPREAGLETADDLKNSLPNVFLWFLYPHYRTHGLHHPFVAYARFLAREARRGARDAAARSALERLAGRHFVFAMQTDTDFQIRSNSQFAGMADALATVLPSFAEHAPADAKLVVKVHPGDLGPVRWSHEVPRLACAAGLSDRVELADGLALDDWLVGAAGLVTVNSTAGLEALAAGCPTHALAPAIYDVPGLTHQGPLDAFWTDPSPPDAALVADFRRALAATCQVRGTIYSRAGTRAAAEAMARRIAAGAVGPTPQREPPRHGKARALGIR